jgi:SulP family sulfate permease
VPGNFLPTSSPASLSDWLHCRWRWPFAIAAGASPQAGLYTGVVAGFLISALGGSRCQIGGPTGAFVVIIFGILAKCGENGLLVCTIMAGVLLVLLGLTGLGTAVKFIPRPVIVGFTQRHRHPDC